jgi:hypothetical protein
MHSDRVVPSLFILPSLPGVRAAPLAGRLLGAQEWNRAGVARSHIT